MANNFRVYWKNAQLFQDLPTTGAGSAAGDPVLANGDNVGINLWGTGAGEGIPAGSDYGMVALDGTAVVNVDLAAAVTEGSPIYIAADNTLSDSDGAGANVLFGFADEPAAIGTDVRIGVRIKSQVNA
jgi:hypothetical protein